ncbi:MAG TPA: ABC transporter permease [Deltaproteobacteria bacterium]|nr:ABC transporter permease [Deltaproteobacteria bacterium]
MMDGFDMLLVASAVIAGATPLVMATLGETLTERAGVVNLSLDGTIVLSAMAAFVVASLSGSLLAGFAVSAAVGACVAALVALFSVRLGMSQVAVGFVLTLMTRDLAYFLGSQYARTEGPISGSAPVPVLSGMPVLGQVLFNHSVPVYLSMIMVAFAWWYLYRTSWGLRLRCVGENMEAAYARGIDPDLVRVVYTVAGGALVGLSGAAFSLCTKPGWGQPQGCEGSGWIALALVIFGAWHPVRAALGAYLFAFLQVMSIHFQSWFPDVPAQVFQVAPFPLMIFLLAVSTLVHSEEAKMLAERHPLLRILTRGLAQAPPLSLGKARSRD